MYDKVLHRNVKLNKILFKRLHNYSDFIVLIHSKVLLLISFTYVCFVSCSKLKTLCRLEVVTTLQNKKHEVRDYAMENGIVMRTWPVTFDIEGFHIGIVVSFGHLIPKKIINSFPL